MDPLQVIGKGWNPLYCYSFLDSVFLGLGWDHFVGIHASLILAKFKFAFETHSATISLTLSPLPLGFFMLFLEHLGSNHHQ